MYTCICLYICMYIYIHIYVLYVYIHMRVYMHVYIHTYIYIWQTAEARRRGCRKLNYTTAFSAWARCPRFFSSPKAGIAMWCGTGCVTIVIPWDTASFSFSSNRCCSVLQCVAVCCSVLQCVAVCCSVLQCVADSDTMGYRWFRILIKQVLYICMYMLLRCVAPIHDPFYAPMYMCMYVLCVYMYILTCIYMCTYTYV